jgi:CHRD domain-containing protein
MNLTGLNEITGAHIHNGSAGQNGDIVVILSGQRSAENGNNSTISFKWKYNIERPARSSER